MFGNRNGALWQLKVELGSFHKLQFYSSVVLLMIKMSQSAREKLDSYCKKCVCRMDQYDLTWTGA